MCMSLKRIEPIFEKNCFLIFSALIFSCPKVVADVKNSLC